MEEIRELDFGSYSSRSEEVKKSLKKVNFNMDGFSTYEVTEAFKTLKVNLFFCGSDIKTILVTSTSENEGKSTVSARLAKSLAESGKKTLLMDADMRKSELLKKSSRRSEIVGLSNVLSGISELDEAIFNTQDENFDVIFAGHFSAMAVELLENGRLKAALEILKERYDYIIIDSPPVGMVIDAAVIATMCDGVIFVVADSKTSRKLAREAKKQLESSGCKILGAVINSTEKTTGTYEYKYYKKKGYYK